MKTEQEQIDDLEGAINIHEEVLALLVSALVDEENLSEDARDGIEKAHELIYGKNKR
jgi:hypothetical protein